MKSKPDKPIIMQYIQAFFDMFREGETFKSENIVRYVRANTGKQFFPDTILRHARSLRQEGKINYTYVCKMNREIRVLKPGEPHSI